METVSGKEMKLNVIITGNNIFALVLFRGRGLGSAARRCVCPALN
jgi:hypothetical protein